MTTILRMRQAVVPATRAAMSSARAMSSSATTARNDSVFRSAMSGSRPVKWMTSERADHFTTRKSAQSLFASAESHSNHAGGWAGADAAQTPSQASAASGINRSIRLSFDSSNLAVKNSPLQPASKAHLVETAKKVAGGVARA